MRRLLRPRRHLRRDECGAVIEAAALLCATADIRWRLATGPTGSDPVDDIGDLAESLLRCRRESRVFPLPEASRRWFELRYANPDAGYALAIILIWSYGATRQAADANPAADPVAVAMWKLRHLTSPTAHRALRTIEVSYRRAVQLMANAGPAPVPGG